MSEKDVSVEEREIGANLHQALVLRRGLARLGWTLESVEIDLSDETARMELRKQDLVVTFDARNGKSSVTRERAEIVTEFSGRERFRADRIRMRFVGRASFIGLRVGLRNLCDYLADNSTARVEGTAVRNLLRPLLSAPPPQDCPAIAAELGVTP